MVLPRKIVNIVGFSPAFFEDFFPIKKTAVQMVRSVLLPIRWLLKVEVLQNKASLSSSFERHETHRKVKSHGRSLKERNNTREPGVDESNASPLLCRDHSTIPKWSIHLEEGSR